MSREVRPGKSSTEDAEATPPPVGPTPNRRSGYVREILETLVLTALVFFVVRAVIQPYQVDGPSMQPGLHTGEYLLISPVVYAFGGGPQRGDVVVFHPPGQPDTAFVKRVIGLPGDVIAITANTITVNGKALTEPYVSQPGFDVIPECMQGPETLTVPPGQYWVMGDNRGDSTDSRCFGTITRQSIIGKAELTLLPLNDFHILNTYSSTFSGIGAPPTPKP